MTLCFLTKVDIHVENAEPLLKGFFGHSTHDSEGESVAQTPKHGQSKEVRRTRRETGDSHKEEKETCLSTANTYLNQARAMVRSPFLDTHLYQGACGRRVVWLKCKLVHVG